MIPYSIALDIVAHPRFDMFRGAQAVIVVGEDYIYHSFANPIFIIVVVAALLFLLLLLRCVMKKIK